MLACEQKGEELFQDQMPKCFAGAKREGGDLHEHTLEMLQAITFFSSMLLSMRQQAPDLVPVLPDGWLDNDAESLVPDEIPSQLGRWGANDEHVALVGGCGLQKGKADFAKFRRMDMRYSSPPTKDNAMNRSF